MQVNAVNSATSAASASASATGATVDYDNFLKLLVQELQNQDPTNPSDPTQYLSQLASFSNVEQGIQTNTKLDTLLTTASLTQAEMVIGKHVTSADGTISGKVVSVSLSASGVATATLKNGKTLVLNSSITIGEK